MRLLVPLVRQTYALPNRCFCVGTFGSRCLLSAIYTSSDKYNQSRWLSSHANDGSKEKKDTLLRRMARIKQKIAEEEKTFGKLVYESRVAPVLMAGKIGVYGSSVITMWSLFTNGVHQYADLNTVMFTVAMAASIGIILAIPWSINKLTARFVLRLYYQQDQNMYTAIKFNKFIGDRKFQFTPDQITPFVERAKGTFKGRITTFHLDQEPMYVNKLWFEVPKYFNHLMGYEDMLAKPTKEVKFWRKKLIQKS